PCERAREPPRRTRQELPPHSRQEIQQGLLLPRQASPLVTQALVGEIPLPLLLLPQRLLLVLLVWVPRLLPAGGLHRRRPARWGRLGGGWLGVGQSDDRRSRQDADLGDLGERALGQIQRRGPGARAVALPGGGDRDPHPKLRQVRSRQGDGFLKSE